MYFNNTEKVPPHDKNLVQRQRQHVKSGGGGLGVNEVGGYYIHSEYIWHRLLVFFMTTSNFGGAQPPLIKKWGGPAPPGSLPL